MDKFKAITTNIYDKIREDDQDTPELDIKMGNIINPGCFIHQIQQEHEDKFVAKE